MSVLSALGLSTDDLNDKGLTKAALDLAKSLDTNSDDYPNHAEDASQTAHTIEEAYTRALAEAEAKDDAVDKHYSDRSKEYLELHQQILSSTEQLDSLSTFLDAFQSDLSSVSTSIAQLQGRSKLIERRLQSRKDLDALLRPYLSSIVLPPQLVNLLATTAPSEAWLPAIEQFEGHLTALRTGARLPAREVLDDAAEKLRLIASYKIRDFLLTVLHPFRISITPNLQITQISILLKYRPLFAFLQRHAARVAHEFQKAYLGTARWYLETGFRRYIRTLDAVRARGPRPSSQQDAEVAEHLANASVEGGGVLLASMAGDPKVRMSPAALFRSLSLVFVDNVTTEYAFVSTFFGSPVSLHGAASPPSSFSRAISPSPNAAGWDLMSRDSARRPGSVTSGSVDERESVITSSDLGSTTTGETRRGKSVTDVVWKQVVEPLMEYHRTFTSTMLSTDSLSLLALYSTIRLNDSLLASSSSSCPPLEAHLMDIKMQLWPVFQIKLTAELTYLQKLTSGWVSKATSGGLFGISSGGGKVAVTEGTIDEAARRYATAFKTIMAATPALAEGAALGSEEEKVFGDLLKMRQAIVSSIIAQGERMAKGASGRYVRSAYEALLRDISAGATSHPKGQAEVAHWRELVRRSG